MKMTISEMLYYAKEFNSAGGVRSRARIHEPDILAFVDNLQGEIDELHESRATHEKMDAYLDMAYFCLTTMIQLRCGKKLETAYRALLNLKPRMSLFSVVKAIKWSRASIDRESLAEYTANFLYESLRQCSLIGNTGMAFKAVHEANMTKFQPDKRLAAKGAQIVYDTKGIECYVEKHKGNYVVFGYVEGRKRIFKPAGFVDPDLTPFVYAK